MKIAQRILGTLTLLLALALTACGGAASASGGSTILTIAVDPSGQLAFQPAMLNAPAGQPFKVTFKNGSAMQHNWVLVQAGQEQAVVDSAMARGGDATGLSGVIAATSMLNANGEETKDVPALQPGSYTFLCTMPGHFAGGMKGTLVVK